MYLNKSLFLVSLISIFFSGCISQKKHVVSKPVEIPVAISIEDVKHGKFDALLEELRYDCDVQVVEDSGTHLQIGFGSTNDFKPHSFELTDETEKKLRCIIPVILNNRDFIVQIVGHSSDSISMPHNRHLSNNRAIVAAELFYKEGIADIYAKGCPQQKLIDEEDTFIDRSINIYIYNNEADVKNPCP